MRNMRSERIGETSKSSLGQTMTIIKYRNASDVTVQFEDGTIVEHRSYNNFKRGSIQNIKARVGETTKNRKGQTMKIVEYNGSEDIVVEFEDGTQVKSYYKHFSKGRIKNPNEHIGETVKLKNGDTVKIIRYGSKTKCDVELPNGNIARGVYYSRLLEGSLGRKYRME